jgi:hypothetical protein
VNYIRTDSIRRAAYYCTECGELRVYGFTAEPDPAYILCGHCHKHTPHRFEKIVIGWTGRPCPLAPRAA